MSIDEQQRVNPIPLSLKLTPAQLVEFDALRLHEQKTRSELLDAALAEYFKRRNRQWPMANRRSL